MILQAALATLEDLRKRFGRSHCRSEVCPTCQTMALGREIDRLAQENARLRAKHTPVCAVCGTSRIDGLCGRCDS